MNDVQHLSDEAVAAYADGVLGGVARDRAHRHVGECAECRTAVRVQREAASVLRAAPAPAFPSSLTDRLLSVPMTTPLTNLPTTLGPDGTTMLSAFGGAAALVSPRSGPRSRPDSSNSSTTARTQTTHRWGKPVLTTVAMVALAGGLTAGSVAHASAGDAPQPGSGTVGNLVRGHHSGPADTQQVVSHVRRTGDHRP